MLSKPYPSKGTACGAAKEYAQQNGIKIFLLLLDLDKRQYHFSDREKPKESNLIPFANYELVRGKWRDRTMISKVVTRRGGTVIKG